MTKPARSTTAFLALALAGALPGALAGVSGPAHADSGVTVGAPWARATAPSARNGGVFMVVTNGGSEADRIVAAQTTAAEKAELHTHQMDGGVMRMRPVDAIDLPPGEAVTLRPGGLHVMLLGLTQPLAQGGRFPVTLTFAKAAPVTVEVPVLAAAAMGPEGAAMHQGEPGGMPHGTTGHDGPEHEAMRKRHMQQMQQQGQ